MKIRLEPRSILTFICCSFCFSRRLAGFSSHSSSAKSKVKVTSIFRPKSLLFYAGERRSPVCGVLFQRSPGWSAPSWSDVWRGSSDFNRLQPFRWNLGVPSCMHRSSAPTEGGVAPIGRRLSLSRSNLFNTWQRVTSCFRALKLLLLLCPVLLLLLLQEPKLQKANQTELRCHHHTSKGNR